MVYDAAHELGAAAGGVSGAGARWSAAGERDLLDCVRLLKGAGRAGLAPQGIRVYPGDGVLLFKWEFVLGECG